MGKTSRIALLALLFGTGVAGLAPRTAVLAAASEAPTPAPTGDAAVAARARMVLDQLEQKHLDRTLLTAEFSSDISDEALATIYGIVAGNGAPTEFTLGAKVRSDSDTRYVFRAAWKTERLAMTLGIDLASGKISALYFRPIYQMQNP